jgi:hypothetical protein
MRLQHAEIKLYKKKTIHVFASLLLMPPKLLPMTIITKQIMKIQCISIRMHTFCLAHECVIGREKRK